MAWFTFSLLLLIAGAGRSRVLHFPLHSFPEKPSATFAPNSTTTATTLALFTSVARGNNLTFETTSD